MKYSSSPSSPQERNKHSNSPREGDWVCYHCNNLNFSFRKQCNRCKMQTKEQNQLLAPYYYPLTQDYSSSLGSYQTEPPIKRILYIEKTKDNFSIQQQFDEPKTPPEHKLSFSSEEDDCFEFLSLGSTDSSWSSFVTQDDSHYALDEFSENSDSMTANRCLLDIQIEQMVTRLII